MRRRKSDEDVIVTIGVHDLAIVKRGTTVLFVVKDKLDAMRELLAVGQLG